MLVDVYIVCEDESTHQVYIDIHARIDHRALHFWTGIYRSSVRGIRITVTIHIIGNTHNSLSSHVI